MNASRSRATKKRNKAQSSSGKSNRPTKKRHVEEAAPVVKRAKPQKVRNKGSERRAVELVQTEERDLSEEDLENFEDYKQFHGFLQNLDPEALASKIHKQASVKVKTPSAGILKNRIPEALPEDLDSVDSDLESAETASEASYDEDMADVISEDSEQESESNDDARAMDYETQGRSFQKTQEPSGSDRLPIKLGDGRVTRNPTIVSKQLPLAASKSVYDAKLPVIETESGSTPTAAVTARTDDRQNLLTPAQRLVQTQEKLAQIALELIENPEEHIAQLTRLKEIQTNGTLQEKRLAMLTLSAVFKDIIPGYRIRPLTELEKAEKVTKEIRKLRDFEQTLVSQYRDFVQSLVSLTRISRKTLVLSTEETVLKQTAVAAACSLLRSVPHFNFRTELFNILVGQVCRKRVDDLFLLSRDTIEELFREDQEGEASFEGMQMLCKKMKDRGYQIDESTIAIFLHLRLLTDMEARGSTDSVDREKVKKKDRQFRTKKLKKLIKDHKEVERDMREAEATVNAETRERLQGETLKLTFSTYLRILKEGNRTIVGASLEGLTKFATLINVDFFGDLLEVLKELMSTEVEAADDLSTRETLLCIVTAFTLLSGQAATKETMSLDLSKFMSKLYSCMLPLALNADVELSTKSQRLDDPTAPSTTNIKNKVNVATEMEMLLRALDAMFFKQRMQGSARMTAFVKRLMLVILHFPEKSAAASLTLVTRLAARFDKIYTLFATEETARDGTYDPITENVELSNPAATSIWEMALLRRHYSPKVQQAGTVLLSTLQDGMNKHK